MAKMRMERKYRLNAMKDRLLPILPFRFDSAPMNPVIFYFRYSPDNSH